MNAERRARSEQLSAYEASLLDEGEARWWVDTWCAKHNGHHLQHGEDGSRMVVADYDSGEMVCQLLNEAAAIRAPLEERIEQLERLQQPWVDNATMGIVWRARAEAAEERIRELEAVAFHTDGIMHIATERIEALEAENERLREVLRSLLAAYDNGVLECPHWDSCPAHRDRVRNVGSCDCGAGEVEAAIESARELATPSSTEGTHEHGLTQVWCDRCGDIPCCEEGDDCDRETCPRRAGTKEGSE